MRIAGYIHHHREPEATEVPRNLEVARYHNSQSSRHVMRRDLVEAGMVGLRLDMVGCLGEDSLAIDFAAMLDCSRCMVDLVEVILLEGIACWLPDQMRSLGLA